VVVNAVSVGLVIFPLTVINVTICVNQTTTTVGFVIQPVTFVKRTVNPDLDTTAALSALRVPLTSVFSAVF
jgi:hypothetical protein